MYDNFQSSAKQRCFIEDRTIVKSVTLTLFRHKISTIIQIILWFLGKLFISIFTLNPTE